jgi:hypothetical protein
MQFAVTLMALTILLPLLNIETALGVYVSKKVSDCTGKRIRSEVKKGMSHERLNLLLSLMSIENEVLHVVDFSTELMLNLRRSSPINSRCQRKVFDY